MKVIKYVFTVIGLGMLVGAFFLFKGTQAFLVEAIVTEGRVVELVESRSSDSSTYAPVVEFKTFNGTTFEFLSSSGSNPPSYDVGEIIEVLYQEADPKSARINSFMSLWGGTTILAGLGTVFFSIGFIILLVGILNSRKIKYLKAHGVKINTKLKSVELNSSLKVNGRSPYNIYAQWENPASSKLHVFKSENIWFDPSEHINGDDITVLIEKDNPEKYYVDISFLPKLAN